MSYLTKRLRYWTKIIEEGCFPDSEIKELFLLDVLMACDRLEAQAAVAIGARIGTEPQRSDVSARPPERIGTAIGTGPSLGEQFINNLRKIRTDV